MTLKNAGFVLPEVSYTQGKIRLHLGIVLNRTNFERKDGGIPFSESSQ